jgi:ATP-dependent RNA helicase SUPV3L1/SUV3
MVGMQKRVDVAVIDEIQMIGDEGRGWAWTRALMGVPANEVHICGDSSGALRTAEQLCSTACGAVRLSRASLVLLVLLLGWLPAGHCRL